MYFAGQTTESRGHDFFKYLSGKGRDFIAQCDHRLCYLRVTCNFNYKDPIHITQFYRIKGGGGSGRPPPPIIFEP